ncbi:MAG: hypothetical protein ABID64_01040 [Nitrospirota bacterium]
MVCLEPDTSRNATMRRPTENATVPLKEEVKKVIDFRIQSIKNSDKFALSGIKCQEKKVYSTDDVIIGLKGLKKELSLEKGDA